MIYRTAPYSATLNDPYPRLQFLAILMLNIAETVRDTQFQWNTNRDFTHALLNIVISNDLE